ncbi:hypothetical protein PMAYCL1PPCAC_28120, partial [Pristionchus mayeri]
PPINDAVNDWLNGIALPDGDGDNEEDSDDVMIIQQPSGSSGSPSRKRKKNGKGEEADMINLSLLKHYFPDEYINTTLKPHEIILSMNMKLRHLAEEKAKLAEERDFYQKRAMALEPALKPSLVHTHDCDLDSDLDFEDYDTKPFRVDGVEITVNIKHKRSPSYSTRVYGMGNWPKKVTFTPTVTLKDDDGPRQVLVIVSISQSERFVAGEFFSGGDFDDRYKDKNERTCVTSTATVNALLQKPIKFEGTPKNFTPTTQLQHSRISMHITAVVQKMERPGAGGDETIAGGMVKVVVDGKEFNVNAGFLSQWSRYFRAYFAADMEEKKTGIYPVKDDNISDVEFQELLDVIYPLQKPITVSNVEILLKLANRFEMPDLIRRIEQFLIDFTAHGIEKSRVFRIATDKFDLPFVQATLLHRWRDAYLLKKEMLDHYIYGKLKPVTKNLINQHFAEASILTTGYVGQQLKRMRKKMVETSDEEDSDIGDGFTDPNESIV